MALGWVVFTSAREYAALRWDGRHIDGVGRMEIDLNRDHFILVNSACCMSEGIVYV